MRVFLDTNVLLDVLTKRPPFWEASARVWSLAESGEVEACVSALSFANAFYIVRRLKGRDAAHQAAVLLRDTFAAVALDEQLLHQAIDSGMDDLEDAIQFRSALRCGAAVLITRNPQHFPTDAIAIQTPAEFLAAHLPS